MRPSLKGWIRAAAGVLAAGAALQAGAATLPVSMSVYDISWQGSGGYSLTGQFSYDASLDTTSLVTAGQLADLSLVALLQGNQVASWDLRTDGVGKPYILNFNFDPIHRQLLSGGAAIGPQGQIWNTTNGGATCPSPGLGFASGSASQLLCLNGRGVGESSIAVGNSTLLVTAVPTDGPGVGVPEPIPLLLLGLPLLVLGGSRSLRRVVPAL